MKQWLGILFLAFAFIGKAQDSAGVRLIEQSSFPIDSLAYWNMDALGNHFVSSNGWISKVDDFGTVKYVQSIKSYGSTEELVTINTMKLLHFSLEQQTICFFDNTLTPAENCLELSDFQILTATLISASSQSDKIWVMDQLNSTLYQLPISGNDPIQQVGNLNGLLNFDFISRMKEAGNKLFLSTSDGMVVLDMYGSLLEIYAATEIVSFDANESHLYVLANNELEIRDLRTGGLLRVGLPTAGVLDLRIVNGALYLRTLENVHKFELQMLD